MIKHRYCKAIKEYVLIVAGSALAALGIDIFLVPGKIAAGGASGLGVLLFNLMKIPVSVTILTINFALFFIGYRMMKPAILLKTIVGTVLLSLFVEAFSDLVPITGDTLLCAVYGAVLVGFGTGLVIICGASTGGSDFAALLLKKIFRHMSVAKLILIIDLAIVLFSGAVFSDYTLLLYAVLSLFVTSRIADFVIDGVNFSKLVFIITDEREKTASHIITELRRGVTSFKARGEYSQNEKTVIMTVISPNQFPALKEYVKNADPKAFIILSDARSVFGEGFNIE